MKTLILWAVAIAIEFYKICKIRRTREFYQRLVDTVSSLDVVKVKELKKKLLEGVYKLGEYVLCQGAVSADQTMKSMIGAPRKSVVYSNLMVDKVFEIGESKNTVRKVLRRLYCGFLKLTEQDEHIKIFQTMNTEILPNKLMKKTYSYRERIFNFGWLVSILLKSPTRNISNVYLEEYIPENADVTVLAKIHKNAANEIQFISPTALAGSKQHILVFYKDIVEYNTYLGYAMYLLLAATIYVFYRYYLKPKYLAWITAKKKSEISKIDKLARIYVKDRNCSICHAVLSNIINNPCGHLNICADCNSLKAQKQCLQCHKQPKDTILVYPC